MHKDKVNDKDRVRASLQAISVGSYLFQCRVADELGLHPTDLQAIHALGVGGPLNAGQLSRLLGISSGATTAALDRLERLGYCLRERDESDRRKVVVVLRTAKAAMLRSKYRNIDRHIDLLLKQRSAEEIRVIAAFLAELDGTRFVGAESSIAIGG